MLDGRARRQLTDASTALILACNQNMQTVREVIDHNQERLFGLAESGYTRTVLARDGLIQHLAEPSERVAAEIKAYMEATGMTFQETLAWMRSNARSFVRPEVSNHAEAR